MTYHASKLFKHLIEVVILLAVELDALDELPLKMPNPPEMKDLGTTSDLALSFKKASAYERNGFKDECNEETDRREDIGNGDKWSETQEKKCQILTKKSLDKKLRCCLNIHQMMVRNI